MHSEEKKISHYLKVTLAEMLQKSNYLPSSAVLMGDFGLEIIRGVISYCFHCSFAIEECVAIVENRHSVRLVLVK